MATWSGWEAQFLHAAGLLDTPPNRRFLDAWAKNATHNCVNNPIDLSEPMPGATNCANSTGVLPHVKRYTTHTQAANAFKFELLYPWADAIRQALDSGNPYQFKGADQVVSDLISWGSVKYANVYAAATAGGGGGGGGGAAGIHKGWADLQRSLSKHRLGVKLHATNRMDAATLRALRRARKVRIR